ncbi:MAG: hypothetical protein SNG10_07105 [Rikenellaceae bacterium]
MRFLFIFLPVIMFTSQLFAQPGITSSIKNSHLWRGGEVADGVVITTDVYYETANENFRFGFWGGANSTGDYKEFNNYINYTHGGFSFTLVDTYNFSENATYNNEEFFNYSPSQTGRFLDATVEYEFGKKFPLSLTWATIVYGRDRDDENHHNRYSTFCSVSYALYNRGSWHIDANISSAFAIDDVHSANFYGQETGTVEVALTVQYILSINNYNIPVYTKAMWNPQSNEGFLELCAQVITF